MPYSLITVLFHVYPVPGVALLGARPDVGSPFRASGPFSRELKIL